MTWVGIDVSKDWLDVHVAPAGEGWRVSRDATGLDELVARIGEQDVRCIGVEATGGYETVVAATLAAAGLPVAVLNPAQVRHFAGALGKRAKTDPIDAAVIARFVAATTPAIRPLPDAETRMLADLVARRRQIIAMMVAERLRLKRAGAKRLVQSITRLLAALQKELSDLECGIDEAIKASPVWKAREDLLASIPGIGPATARTLIAELPELGSLDRRRDRRPRRPRPLDPPIGKMARQVHHRRRQGPGAIRALHGSPRRQPLQPRPARCLSTPCRCRQS